MATVLPKTDKETKPLTVITREVMLGIRITERDDATYITADFAQQMVVEGTDEIIGQRDLSSSVRAFHVLAKTPDVQRAVDVLSSLMITAKQEDEAENEARKS